MTAASSPAAPRPVRHRLLYAYAVTLRVLLAYAAVEVVSWLRGGAWRDRALARCHRRSARRVERAILRLQGLFIKVGQLVSMLTSFLPEEFRAGLEGLQDQVPPRPYAEVAARLREELGADPATLFAELRPEAIAAASLAQVHEARLPDGRRVAVKVQHLGIEATARGDLDTMRRILALVRFFVGVRGLEGVHAQVRAMIEEELDFAREAENLAAVAAAFPGDPGVVFPAVLPELSTRRVLTTSFVDGIKVSRREALVAAGLDPARVAEAILAAYCRMIFVHGTYHADPHPGNLFVRPTGGGEGAIAFVDFGAVGRLSPAMREGIPEFLGGVLAHDPARTLAALRRMGFVARDGDERTAERVVGYLQRQFLEQVTAESWNLGELRFDPRAKLDTLADLRRLDVSFRELTALFEVPRDWVLLERTVLLLVGLCAHLAPTMNPMTTIRPYLAELATGGREWTKVVGDTLRDLGLAAVTLPGDLRRLLARADRGELEMRVGGVREGAELLYAAAHQLLWGLFVTSGGLVAWLAHAAGEHGLARAAAAVAGVAAVLLVGSLARTRRRRR